MTNEQQGRPGGATTAITKLGPRPTFSDNELTLITAINHLFDDLGYSDVSIANICEATPFSLLKINEIIAQSSHLAIQDGNIIQCPHRDTMEDAEITTCQCCQDEKVGWSWQPFGPDNAEQVTLLIGEVCRNALETGDFPVPFTYEHFQYVYQDGKVIEVHPTFWDGGTTDLNGQESATMIMKDTPRSSELVALVVDPFFISAFIAVPDLLEACQRISNAFPDYNVLSTEQAEAVAGVNVVLEAIKKEQK